MSSRKKSGSLGWRLTARQMWTLIRTLLRVDAAILILFAAGLFFYCESALSSAYEGDIPGGGELPYTQRDYTVEAAEELPEGMRLDGMLAQATLWLNRLVNNPEPGYGVHVWRRLELPAPGQNWFLRLDDTRYVMARSLGEGGYLVADFRLGLWLGAFRRLLGLLLCYQGILLFFTFFRARRIARDFLKPIRELTTAAQSMSASAADPVRKKVPLRTPYPPIAAVPPPPNAKSIPFPTIAAVPPPPSATPPRQPKQPKLQLSGAIDTLNTINEDHLDMRISIGGEREELQGLARAINGMLDRLNAAYQSQLRFVSDASHELRTPISVIQGYANLLDRWGKTDEKTLQESIDAIKAEATGMQDLVEQLLFLARSDNNSIVMSLERVDVTTLVRDVLRDAQVIDDAHRFSVSAQEDLVVYGDLSLLKQALRILVDNAIKYTPAGEDIIIAARDSGDLVEISVTDHGIGIPDGDLSQVFDRFFRADESRARQSGGTGLGLSIFKWIVDRHGGHVELTSRQDVGSRFAFCLPKTQPDPQAE